MAYWNGFRRSLKKHIPILEQKRNLDRNFIMLGKVCSGKSALANFLLGARDTSHFKTHVHKEGKGMTKHVKNGQTVYSPLESSEKLTFQITDLPGSNNPNIGDIKLCECIVQSIKESRAQFSDTFLIVCDIITRKFCSNEEMISILNIAGILSHSSYTFLEKAILVFTHADLVDEPESRLYEKIKTEEWAGIGKLLEYIDNRHLFVNSLDISDRNRDTEIRKLFDLSKPTVNVVFTGNNAFESMELGRILQITDSTMVQNDSEKYTLEYFLNPDLKIVQEYNRMNIEQRVEDELKKLSIITKGISVMVILISLEDAFTEEFFNVISKIPDIYSIGQSEKIVDDPLWKLSFVLFLAPADDKSLVEKCLKENSKLKIILSQVNNRFTWVTRDMPPDECHARIIDMVFKVKSHSQGASFINKNIVLKLNKTIDVSIRAKEPNDLGQRFLEADAIQGNSLFEQAKENSLCNSANQFTWDKDEISQLMDYFLVKSTKPEAADANLEMYPDRNTQLLKKKLLVFGNNAAPSSEMFRILQHSDTDRFSIQYRETQLEFYASPDLNIFRRSKQLEFDEDIRKLIDDTTDHGFSLFIILISQSEAFSYDMKEMLTQIPKLNHFKNEKYFWDHAALLFMFENSIPEEAAKKEVSISRKGNKGIKELMTMVGNRYSWISKSDSKDDVLERISLLSLNKKVSILEQESPKYSQRYYPSLIFIFIINVFLILWVFPLIGGLIYVLLSHNRID